MSKQYFAKYLPVEGKINNFDYAINSDGTIYQALLVNDDTQKDQKVKLFLCSKDIQVGDKITNGIATIDKISNLIEDDLPFMSQQGWYKVIGEISPEAIWVKEGDEFDITQLQFWSGIEKHGGFIVDPKVRKDWINFVDQPIKIKCPQCNTYH